MNAGDSLPAIVLGVLEGILRHTTRGLPGNDLDTLDHTLRNLVFNAAVLALGVLADDNQVDVGVEGFVPLDTLAGPHICVEIEGPVKRTMRTGASDERQTREREGTGEMGGTGDGGNC